MGNVLTMIWNAIPSLNEIIESIKRFGHACLEWLKKLYGAILDFFSSHDDLAMLVCIGDVIFSDEKIDLQKHGFSLEGIRENTMASQWQRTGGWMKSSVSYLVLKLKGEFQIIQSIGNVVWICIWIWIPGEARPLLDHLDNLARSGNFIFHVESLRLVGWPEDRFMKIIEEKYNTIKKGQNPECKNSTKKKASTFAKKAADLMYDTFMMCHGESKSG